MSFTSWNFDIEAAPKGETVTRTVSAGKDKDGNPKTRQSVEHVPAYIWAASNCGKVFKSYWIPATNTHNGYWCGFPVAAKGGTGPIAWQPFVVPAHPSIYPLSQLLEFHSPSLSEQGEPV